MNRDQQCIIVGASHAAIQLIISLRQQHWLGTITVISEEPNLPYQRPPLSKGFLANNLSAQKIALRAKAVYEKLNVRLMLGVKVTQLNARSQTVTLSTGETLSFDKLALCTGARVRRLTIAGSDLSQVHYLRTLADAKSIQLASQSAKHAVIIGGGYIGLETAASLRKLGINVTLLEAESRLLKRVACPEIATFYQQLHRQHGVNIHLNTKVEKISQSSTHPPQCVIHFANNGVASSASGCANQQTLTADMVIVGIGVLPNVELAEQAGLEVNNGIVVNEFAQTSNPNIVAAGDCTFHPNDLLKRHLRLESVPNAVEQAKTAAASICNNPQPYNELPWFWSDQYSVKLQIAGINQGYTSVVIRGDIHASLMEQPGGQGFSVFYLHQQKILAADCVNCPKNFMVVKKLIIQNQQISTKVLEDATFDLKQLLS